MYCLVADAGRGCFMCRRCLIRFGLNKNASGRGGGPQDEVCESYPPLRPGCSRRRRRTLHALNAMGLHKINEWIAVFDGRDGYAAPGAVHCPSESSHKAHHHKHTKTSSTVPLTVYINGVGLGRLRWSMCDRTKRLLLCRGRLG